MPGNSVSVKVRRAAEILRSGGLVGIPTETVYGLAGNAWDVAAVARIFEVKGRPRFDPLIVHVADISQVADLATEMSPLAERLARRFWPGPLTLVLPKRDRVPDLVTSGGPTVAVRIPDHPLTLALLRETGLPLAAPSANPFGRISPTTAAHVREQLGSRIDLILDGGACRVGLESTVLYCREEGVSLLRPGGVTREELQEVLGEIPLDEPTLALETADAEAVESPREGRLSPGTELQHYAPRTPLRLVSRIGDWMAAKKQGTAGGDFSRVGLLAFSPEAIAVAGEFGRQETLSATQDLREGATGFFAALRRLDAADLEMIVAERFPARGLGIALNDRLTRAAHR